MNRGAHGDSSLILAGLPVLSEKPPLLKWREHVTVNNDIFSDVEITDYH
jgi:hypothetical protein